MEFNLRIQSPKTVLKDERDYVVFQADLRDYARAAGVGNILNGTRTRDGDLEALAAYDSDHWKLVNVMKAMLSRDEEKQGERPFRYEEEDAFESEVDYMF